MADRTTTGIDAAGARLAEHRYLDGIEARFLRGAARVPHPATGRSVTVRRWAAVERDDEGLEIQAFLHRTHGARADVPRNAGIRFVHRPSWWRRTFGAKPLVVEAVSLARWRRLSTDGVDVEPAGVAELTDALTRRADNARPGWGHVVALASATGWSPEAVQRIAPEAAGSASVRGRVLVVLVDLAAGRVLVDGHDPTAKAYAPWFDPSSESGRDAQVRAGVRELLLLTEDDLVTVEAAVKHTAAAPDAVVAAMRGMEAAGEGVYEVKARAFRRGTGARS